MVRINIIFICLFVLCIEPLFFSALEKYYQQELENNPNHVIPAGCYTKFTSMVDSLIAMGDTVKVRNTNYRVEYKGKSEDKPEYPYKYELVGSPWTYSHIYSSKGWYTSGTTYPLRIYAKSPILSDEEIKACIGKSYKLYKDSVSKSSDGSYDEVYDKYNNAAKLSPSNVLYGYGDGYFLHEIMDKIMFDKYMVVLSQRGIRQISPFLDRDYCKLKDNIYSITQYTIFVVFVFLYFHKRYMDRKSKRQM